MTPPPQVAGRDVVKVCSPECRAHGGCSNAGKRPVPSVYSVVSAGAAREWVRAGGNVGVACGGDLVVVDVDDPGRVLSLVGEAFGVETFTVQTPGGGFHVYLDCPGWEGNRSWKAGGGELASVRATAGRFVVAPPSRHPEGGRYSVFVDAPVATVGPDAFRRFCRGMDAIETVVGGGPGDGQEDGDDSRADDRRGRVGGGGLDELDRLIDHDDRRADVRAALEDPDAGHSQRQFAAGFLLDAVGLSVSETVRIIDKFNRWDNYDRATTRKQVRAVDRSSPGGRK